ncbi:MAG TPA: NADH-quinone oxidoreductase subunit C [Bacteroidales bacterium]|nr:NADH-quinone oxidoreductase subunit C [Bacteroidales bacterium]HOK98483.1 NADH-quinone oxidoreductase subunit C [Bacteroidales bacterium]HPO66081.1 NADH-quinone oxidoreductase subunit C [Bacteroidales bacterium]
MNKYFLKIKNNQAVPVPSIPVYDYEVFYSYCYGLLQNKKRYHCVNYFGYRIESDITLIMVIADDGEQCLYVAASRIPNNTRLKSFAGSLSAMEKFEREIHEQFGIEFTDHPWLKPVRHSSSSLNSYVFFSSDSEELHEVGVGPIHAGIIEPGHFRFICNGEQILSLEIQLGYQHRGIESLMVNKNNILQRTLLAENIAGDTTVGHTTAFANLWESLEGYNTPYDLHFCRTLAQEIERIAMHTADLSALCADVAYQLGNAVFGRLRTPIINFFQEWSGNRFAKGLIRPGKVLYPFSDTLAQRLLKVLDDFETDFVEMGEQLFSLPSALSRFEKTGTLDSNTALRCGFVGMVARTCNLSRDIRHSHPYNLYGKTLSHEPIMLNSGDVFARAFLRYKEVIQSIEYLRILVNYLPNKFTKQSSLSGMASKNTLVVSLVEGWRGEICHCAITDHQGKVIVYKIKDPSFHNWKALELAVRNNEISDFPICNKSFNLSYCGHDL